MNAKIYKVNNLAHVKDLIAKDNATLKDFGDELQYDTAYVSGCIYAGDYIVLHEGKIITVIDGSTPEDVLPFNISEVQVRN